MYGPNPSKIDIKVVIPAPTQRILEQTTDDQRDFPYLDTNKNSLDKVKLFCQKFSYSCLKIHCASSEMEIGLELGDSDMILS